MHFAECRYAEYLCAELRGTRVTTTSVFKNIVNTGDD